MNTTLLLQLFSPPQDPSLLTYGFYDWRLVGLSVLIAILTSWMGLLMTGQAAATGSRGLRVLALLTGSLALGSGVWAMHFVGMLAFNLCDGVSFEPTLTLLSMLPSVAASFVALSLIGRQRMDPRALLVGGVLVGAGIGAMHYAGMAAMRLPLAQRYDPWMFGLSIIVAVVLATLALWVRFGLRKNLGKRFSENWLLLFSAIVMGCAIAGMHYTGMAAARFVGRAAPPSLTGGIENATFIALAVALITVAFSVFVMAANGLLRYRELYHQLSQSESWMRALLATAVDGVITIDADGVVQTFNAAAERIFGWSQQEMVGRNVRQLIVNAEQSEHDGILNYLRADSGQVSGQSREVLGRRKDGSIVAIRNAYGHANLGDRKLFVCFITDLSERKAIEQALRDSEQQLRSLIANIPGICYRSMIAQDWPLIFISDAVERITGYPADDFVGYAPPRCYRQLIHADDRARVSEAITKAVEGGQSFQVEYRLQHRDGSICWQWEIGSVVRDDQGQIKWFDGVVLDISERRQMEEDLRDAKDRAEQAAVARAAFLANMSHEIRTPMNSILGFTDVMLLEELAPVQRRHLETVRRAAGSLLRLLNEVLDTAKLDKGAVELELADFNMLALIDELSSTLGATARSKGLSLHIDYDSRLPISFHGDELRVRQVLTNLLGNAVKFTEHGSVTLSVTPMQEQLHITITDTGIGIAAERLHAIFDPFTQADASMSRRFGGTGLGTTISKQLVELMGGRIWAESVIGEGSRFHVQLPLAAARNTAGTPSEPRLAVTLPPLRILIVDDVPQNLELLALLLGKQGHTVLSAGDGSVAVDVARSGKIDLVLMDVQMPNLNGLDATRQIRANEAAAGTPRVPVIAMTASVLDADRHAASDAGMDGFATKPIDLPALTSEIAYVLGLAAPSPHEDGVAGAPQVLAFATALQRWGGERAPYLRALRAFSAELSNAERALAGMIAANSRAVVRQRAHRLRGTAANLGLDQLAHTLAQLEQAATDGHALPTALTDELAGAWATAQAAITTALAADPMPVASGAALPRPLDAAEVQALGATLKQAFARGALDDAVFARLTAALTGHVAATRLGSLQKALDDFDFAHAQTLLAGLLADCPQPSSAK